MSAKNQYCLSIAGLDPSGGAGILADIKTFESHDVTGFGVCTAITYQNESDFQGLDWIPVTQIIRQLDVLLEKYEIKHFKIGLIENEHVLKHVVSHIRDRVKDAFIVWDPILKASAGFVFHEASAIDTSAIKVDLITPNLEEANQLGTSEAITTTTALFLKGGHAKDHANDLLYTKDGSTEFPQERIPGAKKHGSGCVLSAAILAQKAKGRSLEDSCREAKKYITTYLSSTDTLLGKHQLAITV